MSPRQLAPGWLVVVSCLCAWPAAAQTPAAGAAASAAASAPGAPVATAPAAAPAASAAAPAASVASAAAPAASAAGANAAPAAPRASAIRKSAPARKPVAKATPKPAAPAGPVAPAAAASAPAPVSAQAGLSSAQAAAHERDLEAIRQALVETTVTAPVRVQSFGWIDSQGRLHEESQFTSDARVRGVRVQAYLEDPAAPGAATPKVTVDVESLPTGVGRRALSDPAQCLARNGRWRQGLHLEVVAAPGPSGLTSPHAQRTAQVLLPLLTAAGLESRRWVLRPRPSQAKSSYERALFGRESDASDWLARVTLLARPDGQLEGDLQLLPQGHAAPPRHLRLALPVPQASGLEWAEQMAAWVSLLDRETACDPMWFAVQGQGDTLRLKEGSAHGLQAGDRLLLVRRQHLAGRLLEPGAVRATALLQVEGGSGNALRWLAGPNSAPVGPGASAADDWVVLPL